MPIPGLRTFLELKQTNQIKKIKDGDLTQTNGPTFPGLRTFLELKQTDQIKKIEDWDFTQTNGLASSY